MQWQQQVSLYPYNTFRIGVKAQYFSAFQSVEDLQAALDRMDTLHPNNTRQQQLILGGGSNILFTKDWEGLVLKNEMEGIALVNEDADYYYLQAAGGENWHKLVMYCVENNYAGMENLSLIPGSVGASPIQNIGAYGVEIKDIFYQLEAYDLQDKKVVRFGVNECEFGYRDSIFKRRYKARFVILNVTFRLRKKPVFDISYGAIRQELEKMGVEAISVAAISQAVIRIRQSKLPDPAILGNAGSFFKNPVIDAERYSMLKASYPNIAAFAVNEQQWKLAAGWLIEQCGWKGYRQGDAGCYDKQALVLVNYGSATGMQIFDLSTAIIHSVEDKFAITLEREVNIL